MDKTKGFEDPHEKLRKKVDSIFGENEAPIELQRVKENLSWIKEIKEHPVAPGVGEVKVFGCELVDINSILKDNIWNRSIFTVDKLCKLFLKADLEQKKKYLKKRTPLGFNFWWLMILIIGIVIALMVIMFLLPQLGKVM